MVEWNTAQSTFKDLDSKVRKMFGLHDKLRIVYTYKYLATDIIMSSDEELSSALHFIVGDTVYVTLSVETKKKKGILVRMSRAAKAQGSRVTQCITSLPANVATCVPSFSLCALAGRVRACHARHADDPNANNNNHNNSNNASHDNTGEVHHRRLVSIMVGLIVLLLSVAIARSYHRHNIHPNQQYFPRPPYYEGFHASGSLSILAASYGGRDVTKLAQEYYHKHNNLQASNKVFGDPAMGDYKYLHVVFQQMGPNGIPEVFTQSFAESNAPVNLVASKGLECEYPEYGVFDGQQVKILGALHDRDSVTCEARRLAYRGFDQDGISHMMPSIRDKRHKDDKDKNWFTLAYMKNNKVKIVTARNGRKL